MENLRLLGKINLENCKKKEKKGNHFLKFLLATYNA